MAICSSGLGSPGFCSEMSLPGFWSDCINTCSNGFNREEVLRGLRRVFFFYGTVFVLISEDMESVCRLAALGGFSCCVHCVICVAIPYLVVRCQAGVQSFF